MDTSALMDAINNLGIEALADLERVSANHVNAHTARSRIAHSIGYMEGVIEALCRQLDAQDAARSGKDDDLIAALASHRSKIRPEQDFTEEESDDPR